ncbi:MAG: M20/M25/M40 family metallo-hydrolase [Vicinamibacterales bacterium]
MTRSLWRFAGVVVVAGGLVTAGVAVAARQAPEPVDAPVNAKIRDEGLHRSQVAELFSTLVDDIGPRLASSPAYTRAAAWARDRMTGWGLANVHQEPFDFGRGWTLDRFTIEMVSPRYMPLVGYPEAWCPSTSGEVVARAVSLAGRSADDVERLGASLAGAAVLQAPPVDNFIRTDREQPTDRADDPPPPDAARGRGQAGRGRGRGGRGGAPSDAARIAAAIRTSGAAVLLKPSRGEHGTLFVQAGRGENPDDPVPKVVLIGEHYNLIARLLARGEDVRLRVNVQGRLHDERQTYNVLGEIPGSDPSIAGEVVMLGAHLDSWHTATGATDNADGVAASLEAFRILKAIGARPRRTVRLALWAAEEEGLLGSRAWAAAHLAADAPAAARERVSVYFNIDPGKGPIYGWYLQGNQAVAPIFDAWLAPFRDLGARRNVQQSIGSTDHLSFIDEGVPGFNPVQDYTNYDVREHHTNVDTAERIDVADLQQNAIVLASFVYHAANRVEPLPSDVRR